VITAIQNNLYYIEELYRLMVNPISNEPEDFDELERKIQEYNLERTGNILICPQCGSNNVTYYMGLKLGVQYQCKDCNYIGSFIIEDGKS
jgi:predicted RNA-binding Zn-ribbon protein involved in translation (DUF1610 family)